jgi:hypothetical protein
VKEKRKGPISLAGGLVDSVAATVRRMQRDREPRVLAYDPTGYARLIQPEARGYERILEIGERMVALAGEGNGSGVANGEAEERDAEGSTGPKPKSRAAARRSARSANAATADAAGGPAKAKARAAKPRRSAKDGAARPARRARRREDA